eukprot:gnl/MRDRNA2_/MRDRNA2_36774_c0_seq1.p1 gnl/MRDRNA2_/MRDRNA2_36774_c0~~gnl/MRDRNA2_/MRDRNA2_36774_c0_seq1.p1  ORF type:complete len:569 (-),score=144.22 gnl/MRDRNA2_/MRDRNA2_36774_c0_seq1:55-1761(-)
MDDATAVLPPLKTPLRPGSRGSSCRATFLRNTLQKLNADGVRRGQVAEDSTDPLDVKIGHTFRPDHTYTQLDPWQHDRCYVTDRCYLKGILTQDLERYRAAFAEDLREQLAAVQAAVHETDVGGLSQRFLNEVNVVRQREEETLQECARLRTHLEELLRLNAELRQHELLLEMDKVKKHTQKLEDDAVAIQEHSAKMEAGANTMLSCTGQIKELLGPVGSLIEKRCQEVQVGVVDEIRKLVLGELQPLKGNVQDIQTRLKRLEGLHDEHSKTRHERHSIVEQRLNGLDQKMTNTFEISHSERVEVLERLSKLSEGVQSHVLEAARRFMGKGSGGGDDFDKLMSSLAKQTSMLSDNQKAMMGRIEEVSAKTIESVNILQESVQSVPDIISKQIDNMDTAEEAEVRKMKAENESMKRQLDKANRELIKEKEKGGGAPMLIKLLDIEERGNVAINFRTGEVDVKRDIPFDPKNQKEEPLGEFKDEKIAMAIINDIFEIWDIFQVPMKIEGHTKGGENEFWQALANNRAALIVDTLVSMGADKSKMFSKGLPGKLGLNKVGVVVNLDIFPNR